MQSPDINFSNIRKHRSSQNDGFEELTRQLIQAEPPTGYSSIENRGPGADGGVEILVRFPSGRVWGWQSKYFPDGFGPSEVAQVKKSFSSALKNFETLEKYVVAIPRNLSGPAESDNSTQTRNWQDFKKWCEDQAAASGRKVQIDLWDDTYFVSRLQRSEPVYAGMRLYWFDQTVLDSRWFERHLSKSLEFIGKRYRKADHIDIAIEKTVEIIRRESAFADRLSDVWRCVESSLKTMEKIMQSLPNGAKRTTDFENTKSILRRIVDASKLLDPNPLYSDEIADLLAKLREVQNDPSMDYVLNQARFEQEAPASTSRNSKRVTAYDRTVRDRLAKLKSEVDDAIKIFSGPEISLIRTPSLLVEGRAGIGKSHLIARQVEAHIAAGNPAVFIPARVLEHGEKPEREILEYLDLKDLRFEVFLGALEAAAKASGHPALFAIDGINESFHADGWQSGLPGLLAQIKNFKRISFCVSIREAYKKLCVRPNLDLVAIPHVGFSTNLGEAAREYLDRNGIERPSVPLFELRDILYNPLFLSTAVDYMLAKKLTGFPRGLDSMARLIEFWLEAIEINLTSKGYDRIAPGDGKLPEAARRLALAMAEKSSEYLDLSSANQICEEVLDLCRPSKVADRFLNRLIDEGMLLDTPDYGGSGNGRRVSFAFQQFGDYFIADAIIQSTATRAKLAAAIRPGGKFNYMFDENAHWQFIGERVALLALTPKRFGVELPELEAELNGVITIPPEDFVASLQWRHGTEITAETLAFAENLRKKTSSQGRDAVVSDELWFETLLKLAAIPENSLNAKFLKRTLADLSLAERDATWSLYLVGKTETDDDDWSPVQELVNWSWTAPVAKIDLQTIHLAATTLALMTSTMDRKARDSATKGLSSLLMKYPSAISPLIDEFKDWDDAYVRERVLAAALGGVIYCIDNKILKSVAEAVDRMVFRREMVERHAWVRRYGCMIVEHAVNRSAELDQSLVARATAPYNSLAITEWPELQDVAQYRESAWAIVSSVVGFIEEEEGKMSATMAGDFGRYTMSGIGTSFSAEIRGEVPPTSRNAEIERFWDEAESEDPGTRALRGQLEKAMAQMTEVSVLGSLRDLPDIGKLIGKMNPDSDEIEEISLRLLECTFEGDENAQREKLEQCLNDLVNQLKGLISEGLRQRYDQLLPLERRNSDHIEKFSAQKARLWVADRAIKLGWSSASHQPIEMGSMGLSYGRLDHQIERIGKKYQHIALQELIGYLADHHWFIDWNAPPSILTAIENSSGADIDPTYLAGDFSKPVATHFPSGIAIPVLRFKPSTARQNMTWAATTADIPDAKPFLVQTDDYGTVWYLQRSSVRSENYMASLESDEPFRCAQHITELVLFAQGDAGKLDELTTETLGGDDRDLLSDSRDALGFLGQRSSVHLTTPLAFERTFEVAGLKFGRFVEGFSPKSGEYDQSGVSSDRAFDVPTASLIFAKKLKPFDAWSSYYVSDDGKPAFAHDPRRAYAGVSVIRADVIETFANDHGLEPVWIVWAEKDGGKGNNRSTGGERLFTRKDFIGFYHRPEGKWRGKLIRFRE